MRQKVSEVSRRHDVNVPAGCDGLRFTPVRVAAERLSRRRQRGRSRPGQHQADRDRAAGQARVRVDGSIEAAAACRARTALAFRKSGYGFDVRPRDHQQVGDRCQPRAQTGREAGGRSHDVQRRRPDQRCQRQQLSVPARQGSALLVAD